MYTGSGVKVRLFASIVVLTLSATPVFGVVCQLDCDGATAVPECHKASHAGLTIGGADHGCNHDHTTGSPALLTNANSRDSVDATIGVLINVVSSAVVTGTNVARPFEHGPPGATRTLPPSTITILRI